MNAERLRQHLNRWGWKRLHQAKSGTLLERSCPEHLAFLVDQWNRNQQQARLQLHSSPHSLPPALLRLRQAQIPEVFPPLPTPPPDPSDPLLGAIWKLGLELVAHWSSAPDREPLP